MTTVKRRTAEAIAPMLSAFHAIGDQHLRGVWHVYTEGSLDRMILDFGQISLVVVADENDDSLNITAVETGDLCGMGGVDGSRLEPWINLIGKPFGWGWVTVNQQGYCDGLLLSFGGIIPQVVLNVMSSSIKVGTISSLVGFADVGHE
jgi:Family of unknown function (DUF6334)